MEALDELESEPQESHSRGTGFESLCAHTHMQTNQSAICSSAKLTLAAS